MIPENLKNLYVPSIAQEHCKPQVSFYEYLLSMGEGQFAAIEAVRLYDQCFPLSNAIDKRARAFASLPIKVYNKSEEKFIDTHPILDLLAKPNAAENSKAFLEAFSAFYDITGNTMAKGTYAGGTENPPLEIFVEAPTLISIMPSRMRGTTGFAGEYLLTPPYSQQENYKLDDSQRNFRYIESQRGEGVRDLIHVKRFNPNKSGNGHLWGASRAKSITLEIQQFIEGNKTNHGTLLNGVRPSGAFVGATGTELTDTQWSRLKELAEAYRGAKGAGRIFAADGVDFKPMNITNRDMEYRDLRKDMELSINMRYDMPIAAVSDKSQTYNNVATSQYAFYHDAVLPLADVLLEALTDWLMPKYKNSDNLELRYDPAEIPALRLRNFEEAKTLKDTQVNTDNEIRNVLGYEPRDGGDEVFKPANQLPTDALIEYQNQIRESNDGLKSQRLADFISKTMKEKNWLGEYHTEEEALELAKKYGLYRD